jgi:rhodanese-related sulfurtransferase
MNGIVEIDPLAASARLAGEPDLSLIDVRSVEEFEEGHPRGAWNIPLAFQDIGGMRPNPSFVEAVRACFASDASIIFSCAVGNRSALACRMLEAEGYDKVVNLSGGFHGIRDIRGQKVSDGWVDLGLPVSTEPEPGRAWAELQALLAAAERGGTAAT